MRLVPDQDPEAVFRALEAYLPQLTTPGVRLTLEKLNSASPVVCGVEHPGIGAASRSFKQAFGAEPVLVREGGSVPVTIAFKEALNPNLLVTGFGLPDDALHSPNEKMDLEQYHRGTEMVLYLLDELVAAS